MSTPASIARTAATLFDGRDPVGRAVWFSRFKGRWLIEGAADVADSERMRFVSRSHMKLASNTSDAVTMLRLATGEQLHFTEVREQPHDKALAKLFDELRSARATRVDRWISTPLSAALSALAVIVLPLVLLLWLIPLTVKALVPYIPARLEQALGEEVLRAVTPMLDTSQLDTEKQRALEAKFEQMVVAAGLKDVKLHFRRGMLNAFALPGGHVVVTDELLNLLDSDERTLAVLAHELGHVKLRHALRGMVSQTIAVHVVAAAVSHDQLSAKVADTFAGQLMAARYSRDQERESDAFAVDLLKRAQMNHAAFADALEVFATRENQTSSRLKADGYASSHPPTRERIEAARR